MEGVLEQTIMKELYIIKRIDTTQYYHSLTPFGDMLWTDNREQAQWFTKEGAENLRDRVNDGSNPKYDQLEIELA